MKHRKSLIVVTALIMSLVLSGCQNIFITEDTPVIAKNSLNFWNDTPSLGEIVSFGTLTTGVVQDISKNGNTLLLLDTTQAPPVTYNIDLYHSGSAENKLTSFVNSEKQQLNAQFDAAGKGVYYIEESGKNFGDVQAYQLVWTSLDKSTTKTISLPEEIVNPNFCIAENDHVIYTNGSGEIVLADTDGNRKTYTLSQNLTIGSISYSSESQTIYFLGKKDTSNTSFSLFSVETQDVPSLAKLSVTFIAGNVLNFDYNEKSNTLFFVQSKRNTRHIMRYKPKSVAAQPESIISGNIDAVYSTSDNERLIYTQYLNDNNQAMKSIWTINLNGKERQQLTSPLAISSKIISYPDNTILYFSVENSNNPDLTNPNRIYSDLIRLEYALPEK